jgi:hypothetical protein
MNKKHPTACDIGSLTDLKSLSEKESMLREQRPTTMHQRQKLYKTTQSKIYCLVKSSNHPTTIDLMDGTPIRNFKVTKKTIKYTIMIGCTSVTYTVTSMFHVPIQPTHRLRFYRMIKSFGWDEFNEEQWTFILKEVMEQPNQWFLLK